METDFLKVAVFLQTRSTAPLYMYRVRNDLLSPQLHQTLSMHPPSEDTGRLTLTQAYGHKPFVFSTMALLQALHIKEQL